jgi:NAD(P)-dependent dehydrogenase (short-subunit alcohol dehydrogenase family)
VNQIKNDMMWTKKDIPDLTGKTVVVTGANTGLGFETALGLYEAGANVILACRSLEKSKATQERLQSMGGNGTLETSVLDLLSLKSIKQFADAIIIQRATIDFNNLRSEKNYDPLREYRQSKLANLLFSLELQRRIAAKDDQVMSIAAQPGANNTDLLRHSSKEEIALGRERLGDFMEPSQGALSSLYAATSGEAQGGNMYEPDQGYRGYPALAVLKENALDETMAKKLWQVAEQITGLQYP